MRVDSFSSLATRERKRECASLTFFTFDPDRAAVQFDKALCQGKTKTRAFVTPGVGFIYLPEFRENDILVLFLDPDPRVSHLNLNDVVLHQIYDDRNLPTLGRKLDRVGQQVEICRIRPAR